MYGPIDNRKTIFLYRSCMTYDLVLESVHLKESEQIGYVVSRIL